VKSAWWDNEVRLDIRLRPNGFALLLVYALACWIARKLSLDQFYLPAGVRVAALLVCPPRLWIYLALGEYAYFAQIRYPMIERYGIAWVVMGSLLLLPAVAGIVQFHRSVMAQRTDVWILSIAATSAVTVTLLNLAMSHSLWPSPPELPFFTALIRFAVGDFVGILTLAPLTMLWMRRDQEPRWSHEMLLSIAMTLLVMLVLGASAAALPDTLIGTRTTLQLLILVPAIVLTCKYAWRGAAISVPILNLIIGCTTPAETHLSFHRETFELQHIASAAGASLLILGSIITHYYRQYRTGDLDRLAAIERVKTAAEHVRTSHMASEMDLRERALSMRRLGEGIDHSLSEIAYFLKQHGNHSLATDLLRISVANSRQFRGQTSMVYPTALEHVGLYLTLQISGINEEWSETNRVATLRLDGDPCQLSVGLQLAAYRTLVEAVSLLLKHEPGQVGIRARCGRVKGYQGIFASVQLIDKGHPVSPRTAAMAIERLTGRTLAYSGAVQCRRNRIRIVLIEAPVASKAALSSQTLA
jgi:glucose-6-phosphate-specific signal transduction histidine kinase